MCDKYYDERKFMSILFSIVDEIGTGLWLWV